MGEALEAKLTFPGRTGGRRLFVYLTDPADLELQQWALRAIEEVNGARDEEVVWLPVATRNHVSWKPTDTQRVSAGSLFLLSL